MKAGELVPHESFTLLNCEPYLEGVVFTVRRPFGNQMECWNEHTMCCFIPQYQEVQKISSPNGTGHQIRTDCCHKTVLIDENGPMYCADCPLRAERNAKESHG